MSATAIGLRKTRAARFWDTTVGKKAVMAVTGVVLFGYVIVHLIGNFQIFQGPEKLNAYAAFLHSLPAALWAIRIVLLASVILHITASVQLALLKKKARPNSYVKKESINSTYASRTMYWSGPIILAFVIYHIMDFTTGNVNPNFIEHDVYHNVVASFQKPFVAAWYILAMVLLGLHLRHGVWSMFQSLGLTHPRYTPLLRAFAAAFALFIAGGNILIPLSVLVGWVK